MAWFSKTPSTLAIVLAGMATGAVGWVPLLWLLALPLPPGTGTETETETPSPVVLAGDSPLLTQADLPSLPEALKEPSDDRRSRHAAFVQESDMAPRAPRSVAEAPAEGRQTGLGAARHRRAVAVRQLGASHELAQPPPMMRVGEEGELRPLVQPASSEVAIYEPPKTAAPTERVVAEGDRVSVDETDTLRWMYDLRVDDEAVRKAAIAQLKSRGFNERHLELARQLVSDRADVRAAVADKLPGTSGIDARVWLTWLLRDESADVRLAAIGVLATTGPSETRRRALEIARQDRDPRIRKLLDRWKKGER